MAGAISRANGMKGGRPSGAAQRVDGKRFLMRPGESPKDVMHRNMMFWDRRVAWLMEKIEELIALATSSGDPEAAAAILKEVVPLTREMMSARERSEAAAVDLAPYVHAKLASIHVHGDGEAGEGGPKLIIEGGLPDDVE